MASSRREFINDYYYHVFNRGVDKRTIFYTKKDYTRFLDVLYYYKWKQKLSYSDFYRLGFPNPTGSGEVSQRVQVAAYCLMPNHFHLLIKQKETNGISSYISEVCNSYSKYFNIINERSGRLFQGPFKSKLIDGDAYLMQIVKYIHLNPTKASKVNLSGNETFENYPYSSHNVYTNPTGSCSNLGQVCDDEQVSYLLTTIGGRKMYVNFLSNEEIDNNFEK